LTKAAVSHALLLVATYPPSYTGSPAASTLQQINWTVVYYSITASLGVYTTSFIIIRILSVGGLKHARTYRGLIEIMVESALLYSTVLILYLALFLDDAKSPTSNSYIYVQGLLSAVTVSFLAKASL
jgi:hypothetical protein